MGASLFIPYKEDASKTTSCAYRLDHLQPTLDQNTHKYVSHIQPERMMIQSGYLKRPPEKPRRVDEGTNVLDTADFSLSP